MFASLLARLATLVLGRNPWPSAGSVGVGASSLMLLTALVYLLTAIHADFVRDPLQRYHGNDLMAYLTGATIIASGEVHALYDPARQREAQRHLLAPTGAAASGMEFVNPPLLPALLVPLAWLGMAAGDLVWRVLLLGLAAVGLLLVGRGADQLGLDRRGADWQRAALLALTFFPLLQAWQHRNVVVVLLAAVAGWLVLTRAGRPRLAGLVLSALLLKPQYLVVPALYLAWKRQWRQLQGIAVGAAVQSALTLAVLVAGGGFRSLETLAAFVSFGAEGTGAVVEAHVTLRAAILHLLPTLGSERLALLALGTVVTVAGFLGLVGRGWDARSPRLDWEVLALAAVANVTSLHNHVTGLSLLLPAAVALLARTNLHDQRERRLLAILAGLLAVPSAGILLIGVSPWLYVASAWVMALGALGLGLYASRRTAPAPDV